MEKRKLMRTNPKLLLSQAGQKLIPLPKSIGKPTVAYRP
jgi:hypothetical protein